MSTETRPKGNGGRRLRASKAAASILATLLLVQAFPLLRHFHLHIPPLCAEGQNPDQESIGPCGQDSHRTSLHHDTVGCALCRAVRDLSRGENVSPVALNIPFHEGFTHWQGPQAFLASACATCPPPRAPPRRTISL